MDVETLTNDEPICYPSPPLPCHSPPSAILIPYYVYVCKHLYREVFFPYKDKEITGMWKDIQVEWIKIFQLSLIYCRPVLLRTRFWLLADWLTDFHVPSTFPSIFWCFITPPISLQTVRLPDCPQPINLQHFCLNFMKRAELLGHVVIGPFFFGMFKV